MKKGNEKHFVKRALLVTLTVIISIILLFIIYERATINNTYYINEKNLQIPIFVYHNIVENKSQIAYDYMQTTYDDFKKQILGLMSWGYKPITYQDLQEYKNGKKAIPKWSFIITFDDGYTGVYEYAYKFAKEYNVPITIFIINNCVGTIPGYYVNWDQIKEMHDSGLIYVASHSWDHVNFNELTTEDAIENVEKSYQEIDEKFGENRPKVFTYPCGLYTDEQRKQLWDREYVQNLTDNKINLSNNLDLSGLHRDYPLNDSLLKMWIKIQFRAFKYR